MEETTNLFIVKTIPVTNAITILLLSDNSTWVKLEKLNEDPVFCHCYLFEDTYIYRHNKQTWELTPPQITLVNEM